MVDPLLLLLNIYCPIDYPNERYHWSTFLNIKIWRRRCKLQRHRQCNIRILRTIVAWRFLQRNGVLVLCRNHYRSAAGVDTPNILLEDPTKQRPYDIFVNNLMFFCKEIYIRFNTKTTGKQKSKPPCITNRKSRDCSYYSDLTVTCSQLEIYSQYQ